MIVGEGPGPTEDATGNPFDEQGASGGELTNYLKQLGWSRDEVFIDNVVACWPVVVEDTKLGTRKPSIAEMRTCWPRLASTIYAVDPYLILALGRSALRGLTGVDEPIGEARGGLYFAKVEGWYKYVSYPVLPTYHPAFLLRSGFSYPPEEVRKQHLFEDRHARTLFKQDLVAADKYLRILKTLYGS